MADEPKTAEQTAPEPEEAEPKEPTLTDVLRSRFGEAVLESGEFRGQPWVVVEAGSLLEVCRWLQGEKGFRYLADVIAVDYPAREKRFEVIYQLYCHQRAERFRLKARAADGEPLPSVTPVWGGANWPERECYDLMGVEFSGHPDLRRILLPQEATGHPLRKDYPLRGRGALEDDDLGYLRPEVAR